MSSTPQPAVFQAGKKDQTKRVHILQPSPKKAELLDIINNDRLTTVFQPIIDLTTGKIYAHGYAAATTRIPNQGGCALLQLRRRNRSVYRGLERIDLTCRVRHQSATSTQANCP